VVLLSHYLLFRREQTDLVVFLVQAFLHKGCVHFLNGCRLYAKVPYPAGAGGVTDGTVGDAISPPTPVDVPGDMP